MNQDSKQRMSFHKRTLAQSTGVGDYYRVVVRPRGLFRAFRAQDVGLPSSNLQRLAGKHPGGTWVTQAWLISKRAAHVEGRRLVADSKDVHDFIQQLGMQPVLKRGDIFTTHTRPSSETLRQIRQRQAAIRKELLPRSISLATNRVHGA